MILKKPYALFIKFFKLFHLVIFVLSSILLYRTSLVYSFMKEYCKSTPNVIGKNLVSTLFVSWVYILIFIILAINILLIFIMIRKVKPYMYYIFNIGLYIFVMVIFIVSRGIIGDMQTMLVATKTTLAIRDFLNLARLFQTVSVVFYLIRATGFDIKKFDFVRDLQGMDISPEDSEEIEVAVEFEGNVFLRKFKRRYREFKYYYKENKFFINIFSLLFISFIFLFIYFGMNKYNKVYKENEFFRINGYNMGIKSSGVLTKNYMGGTLVDDNVLVVVKASISGYSDSFPISKAVLVVDGMQYYHDSSYTSNLIDIGNVYMNQSIVSDFKDYVFVYKIPSSSASSNMIFRFIDNVRLKHGKTVINSLDVSLNPINYDDLKKDYSEYALGNEIDLSNSLSDYKISVNSFDISDKFVGIYNACINSGECYDFKEVLKPSLRNKDKVLLKLNGSISYSSSIGKIGSLYDLIYNFGSIEYTIDGNSYVEAYDFSSTSFSRVYESNILYVEVDKDLVNSSNLKLCFNFRDAKYCYVLRGDLGEQV